jgi:hypothetical protein
MESIMSDIKLRVSLDKSPVPRKRQSNINPKRMARYYKEVDAPKNNNRIYGAAAVLAVGLFSITQMWSSDDALDDVAAVPVVDKPEAMQPLDNEVLSAVDETVETIEKIPALPGQYVEPEVVEAVKTVEQVVEPDVATESVDVEEYEVQISYQDEAEEMQNNEFVTSTPVSVESVGEIPSVPEIDTAKVQDVAEDASREIHSKYITRGQLTTAIRSREPVDHLSDKVSANKRLSRYYYFTEVSGMRGKKVIHRWEYNGKVMADVKFRIGSNRWRTYSSKYLNDKMTGDWRVVITDEAGSVLHTDSFHYEPMDEHAFLAE